MLEFVAGDAMALCQLVKLAHDCMADQNPQLAAQLAAQLSKASGGHYRDSAFFSPRNCLGIDLKSTKLCESTTLTTCFS
jgi:hypothetical protein